MSIQIYFPKALVSSIREYADNLIKQESGDSIPWRESFSKHFQNDTVAGVCLNSARTTKGLDTDYRLFM